MTTLRVTVEELASWLLDKGYAEEQPGYGHVSARRLAEELIDTFSIFRTMTPEELAEIRSTGEFLDEISGQPPTR